MFVNVPSFRVWATGDWSPALCSVVFTLCYRRSFMQTFSLQDFICASGLILHFIEVTLCVMFSNTCSAPTFPSYCYQWNYCPQKHNENKYFAAAPTECKTLHDIHTEQTCALPHETLAIILQLYFLSMANPSNNSAHSYIPNYSLPLPDWQITINICM